MIIQEQGEHLVLIRQTDHAVLAGHFARELGSDVFALPQPQDSFILAATEHDNGWNEWELLVEIDPVTFLPYSFMSIPTRDHIELYQRGIERVVKADHYAGLLVSMHCLGLYDRTRATMPGFSAKYIKSHESQVVNDFLQTLRLQQLRLKVDLRADSRIKDFTDEKWLQANLLRLEALDRLSLYFCMGPLEARSAFWRGEFRGGAIRMTRICRGRWGNRNILQSSLRCGPAARTCARTARESD